jgi:hypothetical protein
MSRGEVDVLLYSFFNLGARWRLVVNATPWSLYPPKDPVPIVWEAGWAPGPVWTNCPCVTSKNAVKGVKLSMKSRHLRLLDVPRHVGANFIDILCSQMAVSMHGGIAPGKSRSMHSTLAMYIRGTFQVQVLQKCQNCFPRMCFFIMPYRVR